MIRLLFHRHRRLTMVYLGQRGRLWRPEGEERENYILGHVYPHPPHPKFFSTEDNAEMCV